MKTSRGNVAAVATLVLTGLMLTAAIWLFFNQRYAADSITVWQFRPTPAIAQLADASGMSDKGRFLFYASTPQLEGSAQFNNSCQRKEERSAILGCYRSGKIYVYDIQDERLRGVEEVTAAHEMLHAAYERLSADERTQVNQLLEKSYQELMRSGDASLQERMQYYARTEPGERDNELHSILATEVASLEPKLETYYERYFSDRAEVVRLHGLYSDKFEELNTNSQQLKAQLDTLADEIDRLTNGYNDAIRALNNDIARFNARASEPGAFATEAAFQAARSGLVARVDNEARVRADIDAKVADYDTKRQAYNATVDESNSLTRSLDSTLAPAPSL